MDFSAVHAGFVFASYSLVAVVLAGLIAFIFWQDRKLAKQLQRLNEKP